MRSKSLQPAQKNKNASKNFSAGKRPRGQICQAVCIITGLLLGLSVLVRVYRGLRESSVRAQIVRTGVLGRSWFFHRCLHDNANCQSFQPGGNIQQAQPEPSEAADQSSWNINELKSALFSHTNYWDKLFSLPSKPAPDRPQAIQNTAIILLPRTSTQLTLIQHLRLGIGSHLHMGSKWKLFLLLTDHDTIWLLQIYLDDFSPPSQVIYVQSSLRLKP